MALYMILQVRYSHRSSTSKASLLLHFPPQTMALQEAIAADDVNQLYRLIEGDEYLLDQGSESPFPNTPLHDAADQGKTKVAMEIATLKPSYAQKLNRRGYSAMHLALQNKHYHLVRALMTLDPELIRVRGRGGITPLHFVAGKIGDDEQENIELQDLLAEFLFACESSIKDLTNQCETAVHIAVKMGNMEAFKVLFGWLKRVHLTQILHCKDQYGNTVLHIATLEKQPEIIKLLIEYTTVHVKNFQGNTALEIFQANPSGDPDVVERFRQIGRQKRRFTTIISLSQFYSTELTFLEKYRNWIGNRDNSSREAVLIVSTLVAAATYQAGLAPPKGYWQDSSPDPQANSTIVTANSSSIALGKPHQAGDLILSGDELSVYTAWNSMAFFVSIAIIGACSITLKDRHFASSAVLPIVFLCFSYSVTFTLQIPAANNGAGFYLVTAFLLFWLAWFCLFLCVTIKLKGDPRQINATWRRVKD